MIQRILAIATLAACLSAAAPAAAATYRYTDYGGEGEAQGYFLFFDALLANPRNADNVVATLRGGDSSPLIPNWDDEFAGRLGFGYEWAGGNRLTASFWRFDSDVSAARSAPILLAIGPPVPGVGDTGNRFDITTSLKAQTFDLAWAHGEELGEALNVQWSVGLRYADFDERSSGVYGGVGGSDSYSARKSNEGEMLGVRAGVRGLYRFSERFSATSGLAFSLLDGKNTASSSLTRVGTETPASAASLEDDGRSGTILDYDVAVNWHLVGGALRLSLGWEQSVWRDIATDLVRNFPETTAPLRDRDSVTFSGYKLGVFVRF